MCCVMPPASPAATAVSRMASSRLVLPWSTWPMTVMTGARAWRSLGSSTASFSSSASSSAAWVISISRPKSVARTSMASSLSVCVMVTISP